VAYYIGVDLGTTYTAAAVARDDQVEVAALGDRSTAVPSVLWIGEQGELLVGEAAQRRALSDPSRVAREFKRRLGDTTPLLVGGSPYSAEALSAKLLAWVVAAIARTEGEPAAGVAVTHPANWGAYKKDLLSQAVRLADLAEATLLTEPQAAAIFYASQQRVEPGDVVAVFDLGGGTFDSAVIRKVAEGRFDILGEPEGIERLGGIDFDDAVFAHVAGMIEPGLDQLDPDDSTALAAVARLREECVQAKEVLSADTQASVPVLLPTVTTEVRLTRPELEAMIRPRLDDAIGAMRRSLTSAGVEAQEVRAILLVGGSSRIPLVAQTVSAAFGRPVAVDAHPKNAIALGAAIAARTAAVGESAEATAVASPALPEQPGPADASLALAPTAALAGVGAGLAAEAAGGSPGATSTLTTAPGIGDRPPPPPPPVHRERRGGIAVILPAILGLALLGVGAYFMFGRHHHSSSPQTGTGVSQQATPPAGGTTHTGGAPESKPHQITTDNLLLAAPTTTTPVDTSGSTDCQEVAATANGLTPTNPGPDFSAQCQTVTWDLNGAPEKVVAFFSSSTDPTANGPRVEVLTQNSDGTWTPALESDGNSASWNTASVSTANLTGSNDVDPEFVVVFHDSDGTQIVAVVQSNNGAAEVAAQTHKAYHPSVILQGPEILFYNTKTPTSPLRLDLIKWVPSQNSYYGVFSPVKATSTL